MATEFSINACEDWRSWEKIITGDGLPALFLGSNFYVLYGTAAAGIAATPLVCNIAKNIFTRAAHDLGLIDSRMGFFATELTANAAVTTITVVALATLTSFSAVWIAGIAGVACFGMFAETVVAQVVITDDYLMPKDCKWYDSEFAAWSEYSKYRNEVFEVSGRFYFNGKQYDTRAEATAADDVIEVEFVNTNPEMTPRKEDGLYKYKQQSFKTAKEAWCACSLECENVLTDNRYAYYKGERYEDRKEAYIKYTEENPGILVRKESALFVNGKIFSIDDVKEAYKELTRENHEFPPQAIWSDSDSVEYVYNGIAFTDKRSVCITYTALTDAIIFDGENYWQQGATIDIVPPAEIAVPEHKLYRGVNYLHISDAAKAYTSDVKETIYKVPFSNLEDIDDLDRVGGSVFCNGSAYASEGEAEKYRRFYRDGDVFVAEGQRFDALEEAGNYISAQHPENYYTLDGLWFFDGEAHSQFDALRKWSAHNPDKPVRDMGLLFLNGEVTVDR